MTDTEYMRRALVLAARGAGHVNPNPLVGAVIVRDGRILGEGWHQSCGGPHAERNALAACPSSAAGATLYVTLEPCCHHGRTPPCTDAILESGISRVVVGAMDPNPLVAGKGVETLRAHGVAVKTGVCAAQCMAQNEIFFHYIWTNTPFVIAKYAMTMDGKIATAAGLSRWVTGETARRHVHETRNRCAAILVGLGTVLADDPALTCRLPGGRNPVRIICDSGLHTPLSSQLVRTARQTPTWIATSCTETSRQRPYLEAGCRVIEAPAQNGRVGLAALAARLGDEKIDSVLLEGGGALHYSALAAGIVCKVQAYIAPKIFGGASAKTPVEGAGVHDPEGAFQLRNAQVCQLGDDFLIESEVISHVHRSC